MNRNQEFLHPFFGILFLTTRVGEELDGGDVGVAVDNASRHHRRRIRLSVGSSLESRNKKSQLKNVADHPHEKRNEEVQVEAGGDHQSAEEVDRDVVHDIQNLDHGVTHRQG